MLFYRFHWLSTIHPVSEIHCKICYLYGTMLFVGRKPALWNKEYELRVEQKSMTLEGVIGLNGMFVWPFLNADLPSAFVYTRVVTLPSPPTPAANKRRLLSK